VGRVRQERQTHFQEPARQTPQAVQDSSGQRPDRRQDPKGLLSASVSGGLGPLFVLYPPGNPFRDRNTATIPMKWALLLRFKTQQEKPCCGSKSSENPPSNGHCCGVADGNAVLQRERTKGAQKCTQCGEDGAELEAYYGEASAWLHRGACEDAWRAACDSR